MTTSHTRGEIPKRATGSLVAFETGEAVTYGLYNAQGKRYFVRRCRR